MPTHDWARVDANLFHDFHQTWTIAIRNALNGGLLPKGYSALVEQHEPGLVPDTLVVRTQHENLAARGNRITIRRPLTRHLCYRSRFPREQAQSLCRAVFRREGPEF